MRYAVAALAMLLVFSALPQEGRAFFTFNWPTIETRQFKVDAYGHDLRVYEWQSPSDPNVICASAHGSERPVGLQCWNTGADVVPNSAD